MYKIFPCVLLWPFCYLIAMVSLTVLTQFKIIIISTQPNLWSNWGVLDSSHLWEFLSHDEGCDICKANPQSDVNDHLTNNCSMVMDLSFCSGRGSNPGITNYHLRSAFITFLNNNLNYKQTNKQGCLFDLINSENGGNYTEFFLNYFTHRMYVGIYWS